MGSLPASGPISFNDIRVALEIPSQADFSINTAATDGYFNGTVDRTYATTFPNSSTPHAVSEWYSYNPKLCDTNMQISIVSGLGDGDAVCGAGTFNANYSDCTTLGVGCYAFQIRYACRATYNNLWIQENGSGVNCLTDGTGIVIQTSPCT